MVVFVHSLGSLWQEKIAAAGAVRIWNTTGIPHGSQVRSCARIFGQVSFGAKAWLELAGSRPVISAAWMTSELMEATDVRKLKLLCRAPRTSAPDWYLVTVTEDLIGLLQPDGWNNANTMVLSFSMTRTRQEIMLLMRPFGWLRGANASAVLAVNGGQCAWSIRRW